MPYEHTDNTSGAEGIRAHLQHKDFAAALLACEQQLARHPTMAELWALKGLALQGLGDWAQAASSFQRGLECDPGNARLLLFQGNLHTRFGRGPQAVASYMAALARDPSLTDAYRGLLNFHTIPVDGPEVAKLLSMAFNEGRTDSSRAHALFLLGQIFVNAGIDHPGFAFFRQANNLVAKGIEHDKREYQISAKRAAMTAAFFRRHARCDPASPAFPAVIVAGLPRSGKSLVENLLASHPEVSPGGELALVRKFVGSLNEREDLEALAARLARDTVSPLGQQCPLSRGVRYLIDTSPANLNRLGFLALLHPETSIIFCRRNPLDLGLALYFKYFSSGHRYSYQLATAGRAIAITDKLIEHWHKALPNPMFEVRYEELVQDPRGTQRALFAGLGLAGPATLSEDATEGVEWRLFPSRSIDIVGTISPALIGFADRFRRQLEPLLKAYAEEAAREGFEARGARSGRSGRNQR